MRTLPALLALLLSCALGTSVAQAITPADPGNNLRWSACYGDLAPINRNFACDTNAGNSVLVGSFVPPVNMVDVNGLEIVLDLAAASPMLPSWWWFRNAGTCRQTSLFLQSSAPATSVNCIDWGSGNAAGGIGAYNIGTVTGGPNTSRLVMAFAVPATALAQLAAGVEYFGYQVLINHAKTVGDGACAGCSTPMCIVVGLTKIVTPISANDRRLQGPANGTDSDYVTWQGGAGVYSGRGVGCPAATPARNATWGAVKSLYR